MNPVGAENGMRIYEKINNDNLVSSLINKQSGLESAGGSWGRNVSLKSSAITELNEMLNTMYMTSMLQGHNPPPLFNVRIYIWNASWRLIIHLTVLRWSLYWMGLIDPPYCFKVKWNSKRNNIPGRSIATFWRNLWQRCAFWKANEFLKRGGESNQRGNASVKEAKLQRADPLRVMT